MAAAARLRKGALLDAARRALLEPHLVAVGALTRADVPAMTRARAECRARGLALKKLPNRLCGLAVEGTDRAFLRGLFSGDLVVLYPRDADDGADASALAGRVLEAAEGAGNVVLVGGALDGAKLYAADFPALEGLGGLRPLRAELGPRAQSARGARRPRRRRARAGDRRRRVSPGPAAGPGVGAPCVRRVRLRLWPAAARPWA